MKGNVTLQDIADAAGLSKATVSKALRGESDISLKTQKRVAHIAETMGYSTNNLAIYLRRGNIKALGVLMPNNSNPYNALVLQGVEEKAKELGYNVIIGNTNGDSDQEKKLLDTFIGMKVAGILSIPTWLNHYKDVKIPLIIMSRFPYMESYANKAKMQLKRDFNYIVNDDFEGEFLAAEHLIKRGYTDLYLIVSSLNTDTVEGVMNQARLEGFKKALSVYNIPWSKKRIVSNVCGMHESYNAVTNLVKQSKLPIGICLNTDYLAVAALSALYDLKIKIPEEVGLVGYDDIDTARYTVPALTTINQAKYMIGSESVVQVTSKNYSDENTWKKVLKPNLVVRQTT